MVKPNFELLRDFPETERPAYHEGLGDLEPHPDPTYGKRRIVGRVPFDKHSRGKAMKVLEERGTKYEELFPTAQYWVAVVYE